MKRIRQLYKSTQRFLKKNFSIKQGGVVGVTVKTIQSFNEARATQAAASIAYYALFSLFPLILILIAFGTVILRDPQIVEQVLAYTAQVLPIAQNLVQQNIEQALALRGTVGVLAGIGLLWSASGVFVMLARNINLAWEGAEERNFLESRMVGLMIVVLVIALPFLSFISSTLFSLLPWLDGNAPLWGAVSLYDTLTWQVITRLIPWFFIFIMFLCLYRWVPTVEVRWAEALWGALIAASAWEIVKFGFTQFLGSGLAQYQLIYGSLGTVIALMLWIYLSSVIILFGAHLSGALTFFYQKEKRQRKKKKPNRS